MTQIEKVNFVLETPYDCPFLKLLISVLKLLTIQFSMTEQFDKKYIYRKSSNVFNKIYEFSYKYYTIFMLK